MEIDREEQRARDLLRELMVLNGEYNDLLAKLLSLGHRIFEAYKELDDRLNHENVKEM